MPYLYLEDAQIYYEVEGDGYPITFIHGMGLSHTNWRAQVDYLTLHGYQAITIDVRGHGKSTATTKAFRTHHPIAQITLDLYHLLRELQVEHTVLVGYSTGTVIAQAFALAYPDKVKGLFLSGAFPKIHNLYLLGKFKAALLFTHLHARRVLANSVARANGKNSAQIEQFKQEANKVKRKEALRLMKASLQFDCRDQLKEIEAPIHVNYGGNETHMMTYRHDYFTYAPTAEVCLFPNVNHATPTKCTASYNRVLLHFIQELQLPYHPDYFFNPSKINPTPSPINRSLE